MKRFLVNALLIATLASPAFAQSRRLRLSIETGLPLNAAFQGATSSATTLIQKNANKALAGISARTPLPGKFVLRGGAMFRPLAFHRTTTASSPPSIAVLDPSGNLTPITFFQSDWWNSRGHAWEIPVTIERTLLARRRISPFASGGFAWRRTSSTTDFEHFFSISSSTIFQAVLPADTVKDSRTGLVLGAGIDIERLPIRLSPQVRWTSWLNEGRSNRPGIVGYARHSVDLLVGFSLPLR